MIYADNVKESTASTSASSITTTGAAANCQPFSVFTVGQTNISVKVGPDSAGAWLIGAYTYSAASTLTRTAILSSSAGGTTDVTLAAGSKDVICTLSATKAVDVENAVTLTNKRIGARVVAGLTTATPMSAINTDNCDRVQCLAIAAAITSMAPSGGAPVAGDALTVDLKSASAFAISWGSLYESSTIALPTIFMAGQLMTVYLDWNAATSKWRCVGGV